MTLRFLSQLLINAVVIGGSHSLSLAKPSQANMCSYQPHHMQHNGSNIQFAVFQCMFNS